MRLESHTSSYFRELGFRDCNGYFFAISIGILLRGLIVSQRHMRNSIGGER